MAALDSKNEQHHTSPVYPTHQPPSDSSSRVLKFGHRTKIFIIALAIITSVGLHLATILCTPKPATTTHHRSAPEFDWHSVEPSTEIKWTPCYDNQQCARVLLPLDYLSDKGPLGPTTAIALRMIPARDRANYRGTVLINPGGPGGSGTNLLARAGHNIATIVGDSFDVLGFDPRGVGASTPALNCFLSKGQRDIWQTQEGHQVLNASDDALVGLFRARQRVVGDRCRESDGGEEGIARFMSTASVATDMLRITQKLGQHKLHYWGFSYGSVLGQYFTAMYPDKVGRVIIDGVYDSNNYRETLWNSNLMDNEAVIGSLFTYCHAAGPLKCALYESSPEKIRERYHRVLAAVQRNPVPVPRAEPPLLITHKALANQLFRAAYKPLNTYSTVVATIRAIETANQTALTTLAPLIVDPTECACRSELPQLIENDAFSAIACGDGEAHTFDAAAYKAFYNELTKDAPTAGPFWAAHSLGCTQWSVRPKWRYTGALAAANTSHPILIVQPRFDPVCPLRDALAVRARFGGAGLLVQNSYGHCSPSAPSVCTAKHVRAYMEHGTLPAEGTVCEPDEVPFAGGLKAMSGEDARLLEALKELSEAMPLFTV